MLPDMRRKHPEKAAEADLRCFTKEQTVADIRDCMDHGVGSDEAGGSDESQRERF